MAEGKRWIGKATEVGLGTGTAGKRRQFLGDPRALNALWDNEKAPPFGGTF